MNLANKKSWFLFIILVSVFLAINIYVTEYAYTITDGLVAYFPFNGNANDESGNNHNGTVVGATLVHDRFGNATSAYSFDGDGTYISVPDHNDFDLAGPFTIAAWVNIQDYTTMGSLIASKGRFPGEYNYRIAIGSDEFVGSGNQQIDVGTNDNGEFLITADTMVASKNIWLHIAGVFDGSTMKLYKNSRLISQTPHRGVVNTNNYDFIIGKYGGHNLANFNGIVDEVRIYNKALNEGEIKELMEPPDSTQITTKGVGFDYDFTPSWSPDGKIIIFQSHRRGLYSSLGSYPIYDIYTINPHDENPMITLRVVLKNIVECPDCNGFINPFFVGNSNSVIFVQEINHLWEYMRIDIAASLPVQRTLIDGSDNDFESLLLVPGGLGGYRMIGSLDGNKLAWEIYYYPSLYTEIRVAPAVSIMPGVTGSFGESATTKGTRIFSSGRVDGISFSPDGSRIVIAASRDGIGFDLYVVNADGTGSPISITSDGASRGVKNIIPSWSSNNKIAFSSNKTGRDEIYLINPDGSNHQQVTYLGGTSPSWSPDASKIAFISHRNSYYNIWMIDFNISSNQLPTLSFPTTELYAENGIEPNKGTTETEFTFKTVYTDADNDSPQNISLITGDGIATTTRALVADASAPVELRDGNYANGEQFTATSTFPKKAKYFYHFEASDGKGGVARAPTMGELQFSVINVPVIIVPGIMGSELFGNFLGARLDPYWPPTIPDDILLPIIPPKVIDRLQLNVLGQQTWYTMQSGDIFRKYKDSDIFESLIRELITNGYTEEGGDKDLFVFPYDWRFNIITLAAIGESSLKAKIESIKNQTGAQKVDIIAHSQGGLLSKFYIAGHGRGNVRKFIDIATPHLGAPKAFRTLMWGDSSMAPEWLGKTGATISSSVTKRLAQNMPSVYQLLPSKKYITQIGSYFNDVFDMDEDGATGWLDYANTTDFLIKYGRRNNNADEWNSLIHNSIDNWNGKEYGVEETVNIVGCGAATIGDIWAFNEKFKGLNEKQGFDVEYMLHYISGDGTVPYKSAESLPAADTTYYASNVLTITNGEESNLIEHSKLPSLSGIRQLIPLILNNQEPSLINKPFLRIRTDPRECGLLSGKAVSFHSPIELHIYDSQNRHTGPTPDGFIENNIPGVQYDVIEDNKFAFLPDGETYAITGQATGIGTFNARITTYENSEVTETRYYNEIPLKSLETNTAFTITPNQIDYTIKIDQDGNGIFESQAQPSSVLNAEESQDLTKPETTISLSGNQGQNNWYVSDVKVGFSAIDDNSGILKTEYSLDNGQTWNIYQQPFTIAAEGTTTILYLSTDRAGNYELLKSKEVKIDKTPPEAKIFFDQNLKQLNIEGVDNLSSVAVVQNGNNYTLTDEAGHTFVVAFDKLKTEGKEIKAEIKALRYDGIPIPAIPKNKLQYEWSLEKDGGIKELNQRIKIEKTFDVHARYDVKKNETIIDTKIGSGKDEKKTKQTLSGLTILILTTHSGNFDVHYDR